MPLSSSCVEFFHVLSQSAFASVLAVGGVAAFVHTGPERNAKAIIQAMGFFTFFVSECFDFKGMQLWTRADVLSLCPLPAAAVVLWGRATDPRSALARGRGIWGQGQAAIRR